LPFAPEAGAQCGNPARWDLCGGPSARAVPTAISYADHGRIEGGAREELLDAVYTARRADVAAGKTSLMLAADGATVGELNRRARAGRL
jgi:hypothetical protein